MDFPHGVPTPLYVMIQRRVLYLKIRLLRHFSFEYVVVLLCLWPRKCEMDIGAGIFSRFHSL